MLLAVVVRLNVLSLPNAGRPRSFLSESLPRSLHFPLFVVHVSRAWRTSELQRLIQVDLRTNG